MSNPSSKPQFDEYVVRIPKLNDKKYSVMQFNASDCNDPQKWVEATIKRDLSARKVLQDNDDMPEFGAGSEYGRKQKIKARKLKYGMKMQKFDVSSQPWKLKIKAPLPTYSKKEKEGKPTDREFIGRKEGGIGEGSMYFMFTQTPDCTFEAHPIDSWYSFKRQISHRTLTDEEAEQMWDKRDKILNHLNFMARKRLHIEDEEQNEKEEGTSKGDKKTRADTSLLIHDDADMLMSDDSGSSDDEGDSKSKKKKNKDDDADAAPAPEEAHEESDDGDGEGVEQDYNSDVSSEEEDFNEKRVAPKGLDELEMSSSSSEEEEDEEKKKKEEKNSSSEGSDIDSEVESSKALVLQKTPKKKGSRPATPVDMMMSTAAGPKLKDVAKKLEGRASPLLGKRAAPSNDDSASSSKRSKVGVSGSGTNTPTRDLTQQGITEDAVRRYLLHKPITTKELLKKFKTKKTGLSSSEIGMALVAILKRLSPQQKKINDKLHFYLTQ